MEIDYNIYENLLKSDINTYVEIEKLQEQNNQQEELIQSLQTDIDKLCAKIAEMKQSQDNLTQNISELYKTAKAEIDRKDRVIIDLRSQLEKIQREKRSHTLKRERSPSLQILTNCPEYKKVNKVCDYDRSRSKCSKNDSTSSSREKHKKSHRDEKKDREKRENNRHSDDRHKRKSPVNDKFKNGHDRSQETEKEKCDLKIDKNKSIQSNETPKSSKQDKSIISECDVERTLKQEVEKGVVHSTPTTDSQNQCQINLEEKKGKIEESETKKIVTNKTLEIKKNKPKIEDVTIRLKQKLQTSTSTKVNNTSEVTHNDNNIVQVNNETTTVTETNNVKIDEETSKNTHKEKCDISNSEAQTKSPNKKDTKKTTPDNSFINEENKTPPSGRILRSTRQNCNREKAETPKIHQEQTSPKQILLDEFSDKMCLTHEGEIPVLHISDSENSDKFELCLSPVVTCEINSVEDNEYKINNSNINIESTTSDKIQNVLSLRKKRKYVVTLIDP